jgi:hypothetical protein
MDMNLNKFIDKLVEDAEIAADKIVPVGEPELSILEQKIFYSIKTFLKSHNDGTDRPDLKGIYDRITKMDLKSPDLKLTQLRDGSYQVRITTDDSFPIILIASIKNGKMEVRKDTSGDHPSWGN